MKEPLPPASVTISIISKRFGDKQALKSVDLKLTPGDIYALIGPNGSGKTTLIKIMVGLLGPDLGSINLFGNDIVKHPEEAKRTFGYVSDLPLGYEYLSGLELLYLSASLKGISKKEGVKQIKDLKNLFPIADFIDQPMAHYSRGNLQKVAFLAALIGSPKLLVIDEPIIGLDPDSINIFGKKLSEFGKQGGTVFFATHTLSFAGRFADRYGVLKEGKLVAEGKIKATTNLEHIYKQKGLHE